LLRVAVTRIAYRRTLGSIFACILAGIFGAYVSNAYRRKDVFTPSGETDCIEQLVTFLAAHPALLADSAAMRDLASSVFGADLPKRFERTDFRFGGTHSEVDLSAAEDAKVVNTATRAYEPAIDYVAFDTETRYAGHIREYDLTVALEHPQPWSKSCRIIDSHRQLTQRLSARYKYSPLSRKRYAFDAGSYIIPVVSEAYIVSGKPRSNGMCLEFIDRSYEGYGEFSAESPEMQALPIDQIKFAYIDCDPEVAMSRDFP
jgi:hypothetical protein